MCRLWAAALLISLALLRLASTNDIAPGGTAAEDYVHHCHIVEHEDNDMMRAFRVVAV